MKTSIGKDISDNEVGASDLGIYFKRNNTCLLPLASGKDRL